MEACTPLRELTAVGASGAGVAPRDFTRGVCKTPRWGGLLGHWIEMRSIFQAQGALKELARLLPNTALRVVGEATEVQAAAERAATRGQLAIYLLEGSRPLAAGVLAGYGIVLHPAVGAVLMSASPVIVAIHAQLLRRARFS